MYIKVPSLTLCQDKLTILLHKNIICQITIHFLTMRRRLLFVCFLVTMETSNRYHYLLIIKEG
jgi:hypothetical protein